MISNLQELIFHLKKSYEANIKNYNNVSIEFLKNHMEQYVGVDWKKYIDLTKPFNKNIIYQSKDMELVLIYWSKDYETLHHYHPENGCLLRVMDGTLKEEIKNKELNKTNVYTNNNVCYMDNSKGTHKIIALSETFSLHLYSPSGFYN